MPALALVSLKDDSDGNVLFLPRCGCGSEMASERTRGPGGLTHITALAYWCRSNRYMYSTYIRMWMCNMCLYVCAAVSNAIEVMSMRHRRWRRICQSINSAFVSSCSEASPRRATRAKGHGDIGALAGGQIAQVRAESCDILKIIAHIPVHSTSQGECQKKKK